MVAPFTYRSPQALALEEALPDQDADSRWSRLERYERFIRTFEYAERTHDWAGHTLEALRTVTQSNVARFVVPHAHRCPSAPSRLGRTIVHRLTGLLFSESTHPRIRVLGDPDSEDWVEGATDACGFWTAWHEARNYGGGMGSAVLSWAVHDGHILVERHNPKHCRPLWRDRARGRLAALEIRYSYVRRERNPETGRVESAWYFYRRRIEDRDDVLYLPVRQQHARWTPAPKEWEEAKRVPHGFPRCPAFWAQNTPNCEDIDGEPDCEGQFESIEQYDAMIAHALHATGKNCDPTLGLSGKEAKPKPGEPVLKGSDHALVLGEGGSANYVEMSGAGVQHARENAALLKAGILEACHVVLEHDSAVQKTASEVNRREGDMFAHVDLLRGQYGPVIIDMIDLLIEYGRNVTAIRLEPASVPSPAVMSEDEDGEVQPMGPPMVATRGVLHIPPRVVDDPEDPDAPAKLIPRQLGKGGVVRLQWPPHVAAGATDAAAWLGALGTGEDRAWWDSETAARKAADVVQLRNPIEAYRKAQKARAEREAAAAAAETAINERLISGLEKGGGGDGKPLADDPAAAAEGGA